jgi:hypothetical protein
MILRADEILPGDHLLIPAGSLRLVMKVTKGASDDGRDWVSIRIRGWNETSSHLAGDLVAVRRPRTRVVASGTLTSPSHPRRRTPA